MTASPPASEPGSEPVERWSNWSGKLTARPEAIRFVKSEADAAAVAADAAAPAPAPGAPFFFFPPPPFFFSLNSLASVS